MKEENMNREFLIALGKRIRDLRLSKGFSQEKFSFECNLHRTYIGAIERGERNVTITNLKLIANKLDISLQFLFNFEEIDEKK